MRIFLHNVGHGQAIHIVTPQKDVIVIDLGVGAYSPLRWLKTHFDKIDRLIITHPHTDHIDEIELIDQLGLAPKILVRPKWLSATAVRAANQSGYAQKVEGYLRLDQRYCMPVPAPTTPGGPASGSPVECKTFFAHGCADSNINNHSLVTFIGYGGWGFMFPGDNEPPSWRELLDNSEFRLHLARTDVFMASHHARQSGYCGELFGFLKPKLCVVSDKECQDTDVTALYSEKASGLRVVRPTGVVEIRKCVTTRKDGWMVFGVTTSGELRVDVGR